MEMERDESKNAGWVPHLTVDGASKAVEWYQEAFGAKINFIAKAQDGIRLLPCSSPPSLLCPHAMC